MLTKNRRTLLLLMLMVGLTSVACKNNRRGVEINKDIKKPLLPPSDPEPRGGRGGSGFGNDDDTSDVTVDPKASGAVFTFAQQKEIAAKFLETIDPELSSDQTLKGQWSQLQVLLTDLPQTRQEDKVKQFCTQTDNLIKAVMGSGLTSAVKTKIGEAYIQVAKPGSLCPQG